MPRISIAANIDNAQESKPVPAGPYDLTITEVEETKSQAGDPQLLVSIAIDGHDTAPNLRHYISFPNGKDDARKAGFKSLMLRRFLTAFNIPYEAEGNATSFDTDGFAGAKARMELTQTSPDENESGDIYNRLRLPKIKEEGAGGARKAPAPPKRAGR